VNVALGPVVGPLGRLADGGRNWEGISNDPYLCGALAYETVAGFRSQGIINSVKVRLFTVNGEYYLTIVTAFHRKRAGNQPEPKW
jgi:hypothetical protein